MSTAQARPVGAVASIVVGITYVVAAVCHLLSPAEGRAAAGPLSYWPSIAAQPHFVAVLDVALIVGAFAAFLAVPALAARFGRSDDEWTSAASSFGLFGFAVGALVDATAFGRMDSVAAAFVHGDASVRAAIAAEPVLLLDAAGIIAFGAPGLWLLVLNVVALRQRTMPAWLAALGLAGAVGLFLVVAGFAIHDDRVVSLGAVLGGVLVGPLWYVLAGWRLLRGVRTAPSTPRDVASSTILSPHGA